MSGFTRSKMAPSRGKQFLSRFSGPLIGGLLGYPLGPWGGAAGTLIGGALGTKEAQAARRDPDASPFEFGLSEGLGSIWNAGREARRDQSSNWPELGVSEMIGKTFGARRAAPGDFVGGAAGAATGSLAGAGAAGLEAIRKAYPNENLPEWLPSSVKQGLNNYTREDFNRRRNQFQLTPEEQRGIIMSPLEQEMYW